MTAGGGVAKGQAHIISIGNFGTVTTGERAAKRTISAAGK
jgi:hypothetical protein